MGCTGMGRGARALLSAVTILAMIVALGVAPALANWQAGLDTMIVSVNSSEAQGDRGSQDPSVSGDGRYVAFTTGNDFASVDNNDEPDIYVRDTVSGTTTLVSRGWNGGDADFPTDPDDFDDGEVSGNPDISANGRYVAFDSWADNLVDNDNNYSGGGGYPNSNGRDVFVYDLKSGEATRASVSATGTEGVGGSRSPAISGNGRYVVFQTRNPFVVNDVTDYRDVYIRDLVSGETTLVSVSMYGTGGEDDSENPDISGDGRYVVFESDADDLVPDDNNGDWDIFVRDMQSGETTIVSRATDGTESDDDSWDARISDNGRYVVFDSEAGNLDPADLNGDDRRDVFGHDLMTGETICLSAPRDGAVEWDRGSRDPHISGDGRYVVFVSGQDLVAHDTNDLQDIYAVDMVTGARWIVPVTYDGTQPSQPSWDPNFCFSEDGMWLGFDSWANNIVENDTNYGQHARGRDVFLKPFLPDLAPGAMRLAGSNRYGTSVMVSQDSFPDGAGTVVIGAGDAWADALCGSSLAGAVNGPILLTASGALPAEVKAEIARLGAENAFIVGGTSVVSSAVEIELNAMLDGFVYRAAGPDRYGTSRVVAGMVIQLQGQHYDGGTLVASGGGFADAMSGAPLAAGLGWPIVLANPVSGAVHMPPQATDAAILGGTSAVSAATMNAVTAAVGVGNATRLGGDDRYETSAMIAEYGVMSGLDWNGVGIATGEDFPDGLTGGAALGMHRSVMLLTPTNSLDPEAAAALTANADSIHSMYFFGGANAVSAGVMATARAIPGL